MNNNKPKVWYFFLWLIFISGCIFLASIFGEIPGYAAPAREAVEPPLLDQDQSAGGNQGVSTLFDDEPPEEVYIPLILNKFGNKISISTWTADINGRQKSAFIPNEPMTLYIEVNNPLDEEFVANIVVYRTGLCNDVVVNYWTVIDPGETIYEFKSTTPSESCKGIYNLNSKVTYDGRDVEQTLPYMVYVSLEQAFDKCNIGTIGQMQTWWNLSPYMATNLYIGGISRACANFGLNRDWVEVVSEQGWQFIPTWVGPQAPCSKFRNKFSWDPHTAYVQGRLEAQEAYLAAYQLGFGPGSSIFNDIENYSPATDACRKAVSYYINGWVERLHELGYRAGSYGGHCSSYMRDWFEMKEIWGLENIPDEVWIAAWSLNYNYDPYAVVATTGVCVPNTYWSQNQRIKQYAGDHNETYGGITFNIDSNVLNVPLSNMAEYQSLSGEDVLSESLLSSVSSLGEFQLLSHDKGWAIFNGRFYWTVDAGLSWAPVDHPYAEEAPVAGAYFQDELHGWIFLFSSNTGQPLVISTSSGPFGAWEITVLDDLPLDAWNIHSAYFDFIDTDNGWLSLKLATGSNFSHGELFRTEDGGKSWYRLNLPIGGQITFLDEQRGWAAGGPGGGSLYETSDGGLTWQTIKLDHISSVDEDVFSLPVFRNKQEGILTLTTNISRDPVLNILKSKDGGKTWSLDKAIGLPEILSPDLPTMLINTGMEYLVSPLSYGNPLYRVSENTSNLALMDSSSLPSGTNGIQFFEQTGWARTSSGSCHGQKPVPGENMAEDAYWACSHEMSLWKTIDGGRTWQDITPYH